MPRDRADALCDDLERHGIQLSAGGILDVAVLVSPPNGGCIGVVCPDPPRDAVDPGLGNKENAAVRRLFLQLSDRISQPVP